MTRITFEKIISKAKEYKLQIAFLIIILIFASLAKTLFNFILDWRVVIIIVAILWYLGYMKPFQNKFNEKMTKINYFKMNPE